MLSWAARWKGRKESGVSSTWSALLRCTAVGGGSSCGSLWRQRPPFNCLWELRSGEAMWEPHTRVNSGRGEYPGKDGLERVEAASAPLKFLRSFLALLASLSPTFSCLRSLFCCLRVTQLCLGTCETKCRFWVLNAAFVYCAHPDVSRYSVPAPVPYSLKKLASY